MRGPARRSGHATANAIDIGAFELKDGRRISILLNHGRAERTAVLPKAMKDVLNGSTVLRVTLPPEGVAVLRDDREAPR